MDSHICEIELFREGGGGIWRRCHICLKHFNIIQAMSHIERQYGDKWHDEWNRLKSAGFNIRRHKHKKELYKGKYPFQITSKK